MAFGNATKGYVKKHSGGGGGASTYSELPDKPQINGVTLDGNKTSEDLGISGGGGGSGFSNLTLIKSGVAQLESIAIDINNINGVVFRKSANGSFVDFYIIPKELIQTLTVGDNRCFTHYFNSNNYINITPWVSGNTYNLQFDIRFSDGSTLTFYTY